jgi:hypothetical protein
MGPCKESPSLLSFGAAHNLKLSFYFSTRSVSNTYELSAVNFQLAPNNA